MIKKDSSFSWGYRARDSFIRIREAIAEAPTLVSPDFKKDFILYTFASDISYVVVLTQNNQQGDEVPISFTISNLKGAEMNYHEVDEQAFSKTFSASSP